MNLFEFLDELYNQKTRVLWLSTGKDFVILACVILTQYQRVTHRQTDILIVVIQGLHSLLCWCPVVMRINSFVILMSTLSVLELQPRQMLCCRGRPNSANSGQEIGATWKTFSRTSVTKFFTQEHGYRAQPRYACTCTVVVHRAVKLKRSRVKVKRSQYTGIILKWHGESHLVSAS